MVLIRFGYERPIRFRIAFYNFNTIGYDLDVVLLGSMGSNTGSFQYTFDTLCDTAPLQWGPKSYPIVSKSYSWQPKFEVLVFGVPKLRL